MSIKLNCFFNTINNKQQQDTRTDMPYARLLHAPRHLAPRECGCSTQLLLDFANIFLFYVFDIIFYWFVLQLITHI